MAPYYKAETYNSRQSIGYLVRRSRNLITQRVEALLKERCVEQDIAFQHWVILMCLRDNLASTPSELSQYLCHDSGALTRILDQMEERGLIKRKRSNADRRVIELSLTSRGRKITDSLIGIVAGFYNGVLEDFTHAEIDTLISLLSRLTEKLDGGGKA